MGEMDLTVMPKSRVPADIAGRQLPEGSFADVPHNHGISSSQSQL